MVLKKSVLTPLAMALLLGACSGSDGYGLGNGDDNTSDSGSETDSGDTGGDVVTDPETGEVAVLALGTGSGGTFSSGDAETSITGAELTYGGSTTISVNVVDTNDSNALFSTPTTVLFSSSCATAGRSAIGASATSSGGTATVSYTASSCQGSDTVTAQLENGTSATVTFNISSLDLGSGTGPGFLDGEMTTTLGGADLSFGGDTAVTVNIVDTSDNSLYTGGPVTVNFTSTCVQSGLSSIDASVISTTGTATAAYSATTCEGPDTITATLDDGTTIATTNINVAGQVLGSLEFVSASPETIALAGSGSSSNPEVSDITFILRDNTGQPIQGETIDYELSTEVGGISLSNLSSVTSTDGTTSVTLNAGTIPISVSITATITDDDGNTIVTTSKPVAIVGGIPDQNSFSISVETFNPRGWDFDGTTSQITIRAADRYNNPAPDSTQISFVTEGGSIVGSCSLSGGACSVNWTSQNPRIINIDVDDDGIYDFADGDVFGLVSILARTTGEESFSDINANGKYDVGEPVLTDLDEAFNDTNFNGTHDDGEFFSDYNEDESFTVKPNTLFQGTNCSDAAELAGHCASLVDVRQVAALCMSTDRTLVFDNLFNPQTPGSTGDVTLAGGSQTINFIFTDNHRLTPAAGTGITIESEDVKIISGANAVIPNACGSGVAHSVTIEPDGDTADGNNLTTGSVTVKVTQADGVETSYVYTIFD